MRARAAGLGFHAHSVTCLRAKEDAETWRCAGARGAAILKAYRGDAAGLTAAQRCRKSELAAAELRGHGIPTPPVLAASAGSTALLVEDLGPGSAWSDRHWSEAGATLRRLHDVPASELSPELLGLVAATEPNRARVALGVELIVAELDGADPSWRERAPELAAQAADLVAGGEPEPAPEERRLVHGDFFRANLIATAAGVQVIDWDRLGCGDPAWDVGFLVAAEPAVPQAARDAAGASYGPLPPRAERRLVRHVRCWEVFWALRAL